MQHHKILSTGKQATQRKPAVAAGARHPSHASSVSHPHGAVALQPNTLPSGAVQVANHQNLPVYSRSIMSFRATVGIEITDQTLRMGIARRKKDQILLSVSGSLELSKGVVEGGIIKDAATLVAKIKELRKSLKIGGRRKVALCIPARLLYGSSVHLVSLGRQARRNEFTKFITKNIPELPEDLLITSRTIGHEKAVLGMRRDVLQGFVALCRQAGFTLSSLVTLPMIVSGGSVHDGAVVTMTNGGGNVTLIRGGWIVDESAAGLTDETLLQKEAVTMNLDAQADGHPVKRWLIAAPDAVFLALQRQLIPAAEAKSDKKDTKPVPAGPSVKVEKFIALPEKKLEWLGVCGALVPKGPVAAFIPSSPFRKFLSGLIVLVSLAAIAASAMVMKQYSGW